MYRDFSATMYNVHSGNIAKIGWQWFPEESQGVMQVEFHGGRTYQYFPVHNYQNQAMWKSDSKGKWFSENIKNNILISYEEITKEEE